MKTKIMNKFFFIFLLGLLCQSSLLFAEEPEISWSNGFPKADDVNVGSDKPAYIYFRFDVIKAAIPNAKIVVQFPNYEADSYNPTLPAIIAESGNFIDYTDKIKWNNEQRTLIFSGIDLKIGNYVSYKIPHKTTDALAAHISSGTFTISVYKEDGTLISSESDTYLYRRAALSIVPASGKNNLSEDFATNTWSLLGEAFTEQTYKFGLRTNGGAVDSARIKITIPEQAVIINMSSWKANNELINRVTASTKNKETEYILYLEKKHSLDADGFDDGETIDISFDLKKRYCNNTSFEISAAWGSTGDYIGAVPHSGSFAATSNISGTPELQRVSVTLQNPDGKLNMDGKTSNIFHTRIKNISSVTAHDIKYHLVTPNSPFCVFLDDSYPVGYSIDNGETWVSLSPSYSGSKGTSEVFLINPEYLGKKLVMDLNIDSLAGGKELIIRWASCMAPDAFHNNPGVERNWYRSIRHDDSWTYTNLCRDINLQISNQVIYNLNDIVLAKNLGPSIKLSEGVPQYAKLLNLTFGGYSNAMGHSGALYRIKIKLPKEIKISEKSGKPIVKLGDTDYDSYTKNYEADSDSITYAFDFTQQTSRLRRLAVSFETDCSGKDGLHVADISVDYLPTGINNETTPNILMPDVVQFYIPISVTCNTEGITYNFNMYRISVGLQDSDNNQIPDNTLAPIDPSYSKYSEIDFKQVVTGDTLLFEYEGIIKNEGYSYLYAVLFSPVDNSVFKILDYEINGDTIYSIELTNGLDNPVNTGFSTPRNFAYFWKISRKNGFKLNEQVNLKIKCLAIDNKSSYDPLIYKFSSWFYASNENINTITDNTGGILYPSSRYGDEEYIQTCTYYKGYFTGWSTNRASINFSGKQWAEGYAYHNPFYNNMVDFSPYEYRHLVSIDSIVVDVPDGYLIDNDLRFTMTGFGYDNVSFYAKADPATKTKRRKVFIIKDMYAPDYGRSDGINTLGRQDGPVSMTVYPMIKSTPRSPEGISTCILKSVTDNQTFTQASIPNANNGDEAKQFSSFLLVATNGPGIFISTPEATNKNLSSRRMNWNLKIENTHDYEARQLWLYIAGPVSNVKFNETVGQGEDNRWILIPSIPASDYISGELSFDVDPGTEYLNRQVVIYPIFNPDNKGDFWNPFGEFTNSAFDFDCDAFDEYVYHELNLTLVSLYSQIAGGFTTWRSSLSDPAVLSSEIYGIDSVEVGKPFTVELIMDASLSAAPISHWEARINFPKGLKYIKNSAYIEYRNTNIPIIDNDWISLLETLNEMNSENSAEMILKLKDIVDQEEIKAMFGSEATICSGEKAILRFLLIPTCNVDIRAERLAVTFTGKNYCDLSSDAKECNEHIYYSSKLALKEALLPFNSLLSLTLDIDSITHNNEKNLINGVFTFKKQTKLGDNLSLADSIRIALPLSLEPDGNISYIFPGHSAHGLKIPEEKGSFNTYSEYESNNIRYISWPLPQAYYEPFASKAISDEVTLTYNFKLKAKEGYTLKDTSSITIFTISEMASHISCPVIISQVDSTIDSVYLALSHNALLTGIRLNEEFIPDFNPFTFEYDIILPCETNTINIEGIPFSDRAQVTTIRSALAEKSFMRFELIVTAEDENTKRSYIINIYSCTETEINQPSASDHVKIYPNPVSNNISKLTIESESAINHIILSDLNGRIIINEHFQTGSSMCNYQLETADLNKGVYLILINTLNGIIRQKIIKD